MIRIKTHMSMLANGAGSALMTVLAFGAAVAAASPNDSINVAAGTYKESVTIGKQLSLIGAGATGVANLGRGGAINADGNWWGCSLNPTFLVSAFAGCSVTSGFVPVNTWAAAIVK